MKTQTDVWDKSVEVEANSYNWKGEPFVKIGSAVRQNTDFVHVDLFSGCGGFTVGFERAGFTTQVAVDIHPISLETLQSNFPHTSTVCGDIRDVKTRLVQDLLTNGSKPVSVVTAGVPCQGFSLSNRKRHADDKRNFLFTEFIRVAKTLAPTVVVLENVSGLVSTKDGEFKKAIAGAIEDLGYDVHFAMLNAADYGVPQRRNRVFFVGVPKGCKWRFPHKTHGVAGAPFFTVGDAILGDLPSLEAGESAVTYCGPPKSDLQKILRMEAVALFNHQAPSHPPETVAKIANTVPGEPMYPEFQQRIRLHPDMPSPTQICGGIRPQFQFGHPTQSRGLTIRERARIQSFPDSFIFSGGVTQGRVQTGNAVAPFMAQALADQIMRLLRNERLEGIPASATQQELFV
jgi:DNA (cytosine-5)-methyltransferase 1